MEIYFDDINFSNDYNNNYKLPGDRTMYESSQIYCNLCDYSCDLIDKSAIICNIENSYLWPQMEQNPTN